VSALDRLVHITLFPDTHALTRESLFIPLRQFGDTLRTARAPTKQLLRLFSLCSYGDKRTSKNSLRHDANVRECFAVVGDYDGEKVSLTEAAEALHRARIAALLSPHRRIQRTARAGGSSRHSATRCTKTAPTLPTSPWPITQSWSHDLPASSQTTLPPRAGQSPRGIGCCDSATDHEVVLLEGFP
jgi:hypothetical protein